MAKVRKKVQVIADDLRKVGKNKALPVAPAVPAAPEVHVVSPLPKDPPGVLKSKGKSHKKEKREGVAYVKEGPVRDPEEEKRIAGYAGLARRVAGRIVGEVRSKSRFWFDD